MFGTANAIINNLLNNIFNAIWFYMLTTNPRFDKKKTILVVSLAALLSEAVSLFAIFGYGSGKISFSLLYAAGSLIYVIFYIFIMQKERLLKSVFIFFSFVCMWTAVYGISMLLADWLFDGIESAVWIFRSILNVSLLIAYQYFFRSGFINNQKLIEKPPVVLLLVSGMAYLMMPILMLFYAYDAEKNTLTLAIIAFLLLFCIVVYIMIFRFINQVAKEKKTKAIESQNRLLVEALKNAEEVEKQTRRMRHDQRHQIELLLGFAQDGNTDAIIKYLQGQKQNDERENIRYCSNDTVDMILRSYIRKAKEKGIEVITDIRMDKDTTVADEDLIAILGNMLENAMNGCEQAEKRKMEISVYNKSIKLVLLCKNSCSKNILFENGIPKRSADRGEGIGVTSIIMSADRYDGETVFTAENGIFTCGVILNDYKN